MNDLALVGCCLLVGGLKTGMDAVPMERGIMGIVSIPLFLRTSG